MTSPKRWETAGWVVALSGWANIAVTALVYLVYPGYLDHGESAISAMAWRVLHGGTAYLPLDAPDRITNVYGPVTYLWHAWPLALFGGSVLTSKIAAAVSALLIGPALLPLARKAGPSGGWVMALLAGVTTIVIAAPVVIRPDALIVLLVAAGVLAVAKADAWGWRATVILGLCAGLLFNLKLHSVIYLAPVGLAHVWGRWRRLPLAAGTAIAAAGALFLLPAFPLGDYLSWLAPMSAKENNWKVGWYGEAALYLAPALMVALGTRRPVAAADRIYLTAYVLCLLLVLFPATKVGGGSHYFLPFLAPAADLLRRLAPEAPGRNQKIAITALALLALGTAYQQERRFYKRMEWHKAAAVTAEVEGILDAYAGKRVQMGVGRTPTDTSVTFSYDYYLWRNLPVYRGHPYTMDFGIMMELAKLGVPFGDALMRRIATCHTQVWLIPKDGDPFRLYGFYGAEVIPRAAHDLFLATYEKVESRRFYDIWECRPSAPAH